MADSVSMQNRRPLKSRETGLAKSTASFLCRLGVMPNHISLASMIFGLGGGISLANFPNAHGLGQQVAILIASIVLIQGRLACNLFDGMVAIEGKKGSPAGELFNDIPDRFADIFILIGLGYAAQGLYAHELGFLAALLAVLTAYVRTLSSSMGVPGKFLGPMAKQHRMAFVTGACLLAIWEAYSLETKHVFYVALWILNIGTLFTVMRRVNYVFSHLEQTKHV